VFTAACNSANAQLDQLFSFKKPLYPQWSEGLTGLSLPVKSRGLASKEKLFRGFK